MTCWGAFFFSSWHTKYRLSGPQWRWALHLSGRCFLSIPSTNIPNPQQRAPHPTVCRDVYWQLAARLADWLRLRSLLLGAWQLTPLLHQPTDRRGELQPRTWTRFRRVVPVSLFYLIVSGVARPGESSRVPELKPEPNKNSKFWQLLRFRRWKMSELRPSAPYHLIELRWNQIWLGIN